MPHATDDMALHVLVNRLGHDPDKAKAALAKARKTKRGKDGEEIGATDFADWLAHDPDAQKHWA